MNLLSSSRARLNSGVHFFNVVKGLATLALAGLCSTPAAALPMRTSGQRLMDSCGDPFVVRGVEQILGQQLPEGNDWDGVVREIAATGANAVRILPGVRTLSVKNVDDVLALIGDEDMVAYIAPLSDDGTWLGRADVRAMLAKHESYILIDAYGEPTYDDIPRFRREAAEAIRQARAWGYRVPLTVTANQYGRDLRSVLQYGSEIIAADPLGNTVMGWQAYWGNGGFYQRHYGMTLAEAMRAISVAPFPIQIGLDFVTDPPSETMDYGSLMTQAEARGIGWLWWDWYNPYGTDNNLSRDGSANSLTSLGQTVVRTHGASIHNTARRACRSLASTPSASSWPVPAAPGVLDPPRKVAINSGGGAVGAFLADDPFSGANVSGGSISPASVGRIDRSLIASPAPPEQVYGTARLGAATYRVGGFAAGKSHIVQLHFAELQVGRAGARRFNVSINGERVLTDYDIIAQAGAPQRAIQENFTAIANDDGEVVVRFTAGSAGEPSLSGIVVTDWPAVWQSN